MIKIDPYESNCHIIRLLFGSCLSEIDQCIPFWHYGIILPKHEDSSISTLLNIFLNDLKQILHSCGLIYCQRDTVKIHFNCWETFMLENHIQKYYFNKFNVTRFNIYHMKMYYIGIGTEREYILTPSYQFLNISCPCISSSLSKFLTRRYDRMKMLLNINVILQDEVVDTSTTTNNRGSSSQTSIPKADDDNNTICEGFSQSQRFWR